LAAAVPPAAAISIREKDQLPELASLSVKSSQAASFLLSTSANVSARQASDLKGVAEASQAHV
jgi:hypothetical protein